MENLNSISAFGKPLNRWIDKKIFEFIHRNRLMVNGTIEWNLLCKTPLPVTWPNGQCNLLGIQINFKFVGAWYKQRIQIASSPGIYSWLRKKLRLTLDAEKQIQLQNVDFYGGTWIEYPDSLIELESKLQKDEFDFGITLIHTNLDCEDAPNIETYFTPDTSFPQPIELTSTHMKSTAGIRSERRV
ncbi:MAG: hypothetical protein AB7P11_10375 [Hydrogenophaga sp.]|uniref:hypothetical protein n=2 Tax=Hydrogenophaga sp. TaxID=1904254 RepID=UPI003D0F44A6